MKVPRSRSFPDWVKEMMPASRVRQFRNVETNTRAAPPKATQARVRFRGGPAGGRAPGNSGDGAVAYGVAAGGTSGAVTGPGSAPPIGGPDEAGRVPKPGVLTSVVGAAVDGPASETEPAAAAEPVGGGSIPVTPASETCSVHSVPFQ